MKNNRRAFISMIGAASVAAFSVAYADPSGSIASVDQSATMQGDLFVSAISTMDGSHLGDYFILEQEKYPGFAINSPKRGEVIIRLEPAEKGLVEVSILSLNGEVIHNSFSGINTSLSLHNIGVALVIGTSPDTRAGGG